MFLAYRLKGKKRLVYFSPFQQGTQVLSLPVFHFCAPRPFYKEFYTKRNQSSPDGSKFFPLRVDSFSEGRQNSLTELPPLKVYRFSYDYKLVSQQKHFSIFLSDCLYHSMQLQNLVFSSLVYLYF